MSTASVLRYNPNREEHLLPRLTCLTQMVCLLLRFYSCINHSWKYWIPYVLQSALFNFQSLLTITLLLICACAYIRSLFPSLLDRNKTGLVFDTHERNIILRFMSVWIGILSRSTLSFTQLQFFHIFLILIFLTVSWVCFGNVLASVKGRANMLPLRVSWWA